MAIKKILIANRSEIALRIMRTCKKLGIEVVLPFSDPDEDSIAFKNADFTAPLNGSYAKDTYLDIDKMIAIAKEHKVDAVHPGYGFLSENPVFVEKLMENKIGFIGPSAFSIDAMGDKLKAKNVAKKAGVNIIPGFDGLIKDVNHAKEICNKVGYPVMIKAVAGGGGKGMRIAYSDEELPDVFSAAQNEARAAYKDDRIFIEKFIENPRHIEIQIIADKFGNVVCLGERECSIQRFNQKVIEESPSTFVTPELRAQMYAQSVKLVKECNYFSAGTLEYVVDKDRNFYFLEMNTRLQVEHPVTEYVTGVDLVELMIMVENGKKLPFSQEYIQIKGHAIECRICAENPSKNFLPSSGKITHYYQPQVSTNVRVESGIGSGDSIHPYYDSMVAKLITYGETRMDAIATMRKALAEFEIEGIYTNIEILDSIIRHTSFISGDISTAFIKKHYPNGFKTEYPSDQNVINFIFTACIAFLKEQEKFFAYQNAGYSLYNIERDVSFRNLYCLVGDVRYMVSISEYNTNNITISYGDQTFSLKYEYSLGDKSLKGVVNGEREIVVKISYNDDGSYVMYCGGARENVFVLQPRDVEYLEHCKKEVQIKKPKFLFAPLNGLVTKMKVNAGDILNAGSSLCCIEAMKIENNITSDYECVVKNVFVKQGDIVKSGDKILEFSYNDL
jgi:propionyl-CoA carboxylase alpha chain